MFRFALCALAAISLSACVATPPLPSETAPAVAAPVASASNDAQIIALINAERAKVGRAALAPDVHLSEIAREHAELMVRNDFFSHDVPGGLTYEQRMAAAGYDDSKHGENISYGRQDPSYTVADWMDSRLHRNNILDRKFEKIGVGSARPYYYATIFSDR